MVLQRISRLVPIGIVALSLAIVPLGTRSVSADEIQVGVCRFDPIVFLSNNHKLTLSTSVRLSKSKVLSVTYTLNLPSGVTVSKVVYTGGAAKSGTESVTATSTNDAGTYDATVNVGATSSAAVTTNEKILNQATGASASTSNSGLTNQNVLLHLTNVP